MTQGFGWVAAVGSELFIVPDAAPPPWVATVSSSAPPRVPNHLKERRPVPHDAHDDLHLIADRLRLGVPTHGFDGREIPLRDAFGMPIAPVQAARELLDSGVALLAPADAAQFLDDTLARAREVETAACMDGVEGFGITARVAAVLVSAAVRASCIARHCHVSPSEINRATLSWYEMSQLQRRTLLEAEIAAVDTRLYA